MTNPSDTQAVPAPTAPRGPAVRQFTYRVYDQKWAERFDALSAARFGGRTGAALDAVFDAGLDALAPAAPAATAELMSDSVDALAIKTVARPDSAPNQRDSVPRQSLGASLRAHLGVALGGLALVIAIAALGVALLRTSATVTPAATPPDLSVFATRAELDEVKAEVNTDLDEIGALIRELQAVDRLQTGRLDKLSPPAAKPAPAPGR